jgi:hypothetical protein
MLHVCSELKVRPIDNMICEPAGVLCPGGHSLATPRVTATSTRPSPSNSATTCRGGHRGALGVFGAKLSDWHVADKLPHSHAADNYNNLSAS